MITSRTKYDPIFHSNIPANYRFWFKNQGFNFALTASDEKIFDAWKDLYCFDDDDIVDGLYGLITEHLCDEYEAKLISETGGTNA